MTPPRATGPLSTIRDMAGIPTPREVVTLPFGVARSAREAVCRLVRGSRGPDATREENAEPVIGANPQRRYSSAGSRRLSGAKAPERDAR